MTQIRVNLQTVTPMFLAGAEPRGEPELRPPAFRGAMRYWLRAALGGVMGDRDTERLYQLESQVFGSAADETGAASAVNVRISWNEKPKSQKFQKQPTERIQHNGEFKNQPSGRDYLYWSMSESKKGEDDWKQYFLPENKFDLILSTRPGVVADDSFRQAVAALWLLIQFGGVGSRSRRTAGSVGVVTPIEFEGLQFGLSATTVGEASSSLASGLKRAREMVGNIGSGAVAAPSKFDVIHPQVCQVWVLGVWPTSDSAITAIGKALRDFRSYSEPDHVEVAKWLNREKINTVQRSVFGLPLPFRYSSGLGGAVQGHLEKPALERRASPLWLKVSRTMEGKFVGIATLFDAQFLPDGEKLHVKRDGVPPISPPKDYQLIRQWIAEKFKDTMQEVSYA
jgi:CRISPR-associated protein Cmr1